MEIKYRLYPYPVLAYFNQDYLDSAFNTEIRTLNEGNTLKVQLSSEIENEGFNQRLKGGEVAYCYHVECSQTKYRKVYVTKECEYEIVLKDSIVNGLVQICPFVIAMKDIEGYKNTKYADEFKGFSFDIEKGSKLAIGKQIDVRVEKRKDSLADTPSIFSIIKSSDIDKMQVNLNGQKIVVLLPEDEYNHYKSLRYNSRMLSVIHGMIILPTLIYVIEKVKGLDGEDFYEYEDYRWFRALNKILLNYNVDMTNRELDNRESIEIAQLLLETPLNRAFKSLMFKYEEDDE